MQCFSVTRLFVCFVLIHYVGGISFFRLFRFGSNAKPAMNAIRDVEMSRSAFKSFSQFEDLPSKYGKMDFKNLVQPENVQFGFDSLNNEPKVHPEIFEEVNHQSAKQDSPKNEAGSHGHIPHPHVPHSLKHDDKNGAVSFSRPTGFLFILGIFIAILHI